MSKVVINDIACDGFMLASITSVGIFLLGAEPGVISSVDTKENLLKSFDFVTEKLKDSTDTVTRQQWDDANLVCLHSPTEAEATSSYLSPSIGAQGLYIDFGFMQNYGILVTQEVLKFKAFSLKEDIIAEADLERVQA